MKDPSRIRVGMLPSSSKRSNIGRMKKESRKDPGRIIEGMLPSSSERSNIRTNQQEPIQIRRRIHQNALLFRKDPSRIRVGMLPSFWKRSNIGRKKKESRKDPGRIIEGMLPSSSKSSIPWRMKKDSSKIGEESIKNLTWLRKDPCWIHEVDALFLQKVKDYSNPDPRFGTIHGGTEQCRNGRLDGLFESGRKNCISRRNGAESIRTTIYGSRAPFYTESNLESDLKGSERNRKFRKEWKVGQDDMAKRSKIWFLVIFRKWSILVQQAILVWTRHFLRVDSVRMPY